MKLVLLALIRCYKLAISPFLGNNCRFYPTCADYAQEALKKYGAFKGTALAVKRICRCHPWNEGGIDPVPENTKKQRAINSAEQHENECGCMNKLIKRNK